MIAGCGARLQYSSLCVDAVHASLCRQGPLWTFVPQQPRTAFICAAGHAVVALALQQSLQQQRQNVAQWNAGIVTTGVWFLGS